MVDCHGTACLAMTFLLNARGIPPRANNCSLITSHYSLNNGRCQLTRPNGACGMTLYLICRTLATIHQPLTKSPSQFLAKGLWRSEADSNRCTRFCRPLPSHSAIRPFSPIKPPPVGKLHNACWLIGFANIEIFIRFTKKNSIFTTEKFIFRRKTALGVWLLRI